MKHTISLIFAASIIIFASCEKKIGIAPVETAPVVSECDSVKYSVDIQPILNTYCISCHNAAPMDFSNYAGAKLKVDDGKFKLRVVDLKDMPQTGGPLSQSEMSKIVCWLNNGAPNN